MTIFVKHDKTGNILSVGIPENTDSSKVGMSSDNRILVTAVEVDNVPNFNKDEEFMQFINGHQVDVSSKLPRLIRKKVSSVKAKKAGKKSR